MKIWIDAQLSPAIAGWITSELRLDAITVRELGLRDAEDLEIFNSAREANAIVLTKDRDFGGRDRPANGRRINCRD